MGCVIHEDAPRSGALPAKAPETLVAEILVTGGEPAAFSGASPTDAVSR
jgi:hypothetical protein